jgi:hypothetical protein
LSVMVLGLFFHDGCPEQGAARGWDQPRHVA